MQIGQVGVAPRGYPAAKPAEFDSQTASDAGALHFAIGGQAMEEIMVI